MGRRNVIISLMILVGSFTFYSQESKQIDSLKGELNRVEIDTVEASLLNSIASAYNRNNSDSLYFYATQALSLSKELDFKKGIAYSLNSLSIYNQTIGDNQLALNQLIQSSDILETMGVPEVGITYYNIARLYRYLQEPKKTIVYLERAKENMPETMLGYIDMGIGLAQIDTKNYNEALISINDALLRAKANNDQVLVGTCLQLKGSANLKIGELDSSKIYYQESIKLFERGNNLLQLAASLNGLVLVNLERGDTSEETQSILLKGRKLANEMNDLNTLLAIYRTQVKLDSLKGNYKEAFRNQGKVINLKDSILSTEKAKNLAITEARFQSGKKEQEIQSLLKENALKLIKEDQQTRILIIVSIGLLLFSLLAIYLARIYIQKRKANTLLSIQKEEIIKKNETINKTLGEKELLMQEINHRAKNNIYIVERLLTAQLKEAKFTETKALLKESQKRIQSISLLHNQLSSKDMPASINMKLYINELLDAYISVDKNLQVSSELDALTIDSDSALALGLIINELITNSIKHATSETKIIHVSLKKQDDKLRLIVKDNNVEVQLSKVEGRDTSNASFFGTELVKGLVKQLKGTIEYKQNSGMNVQVVIPSKK